MLPAVLRAVLRAVLLPLGAACYGYAPVAPTRLPPAEREVRVELSAVAAEALADRLGPSVRAVDGHVRAVDADRLVLTATRTLLRSGGEQGWRGEAVMIPWTGVARVRERRLDRRRTALLTLGIAGGAMLAARAAGTSFTRSGDGRGGTGPER